MNATTADPYEAARLLFDQHPLAVVAGDKAGTIRTMSILVPDGDDARFFSLMCDETKGRPVFRLRKWRSTEAVVVISAGGTLYPPGTDAEALTSGIPLPEHGSLLGWVGPGGGITAVVAFYTQYVPQRPEPGYQVMPLAGTPEKEWPPFTGKLAGPWLWDHYRAGRLVNLAAPIAANCGTVFWVDLGPDINSGCVAVSRPITGGGWGWTLGSGRFAYYRALRAGATVPALDKLLADPARVDLAPRFASS